MRIFPQDYEQTIEPCGKAMVILGKIMVAVAVVVLCWRAYDLVTWRRAVGEVVEAHVTRSTDENGVVLCSAEYSSRYSVQEASYTLKSAFSSSSSNCLGWQQRAEQLVGTQTVILYDPARPGRAYANGGKSVEFFLFAVVPGVLGVAFWLGGKAGIFIARWMQQRGLKLP